MLRHCSPKIVPSPIIVYNQNGLGHILGATCFPDYLAVENRVCEKMTLQDEHLIVGALGVITPAEVGTSEVGGNNA